MNINNFDASSTGLNITVSAFYDTDLSRFYFEEAFFKIKEGRKELLVYGKGHFSDFEKEYTLKEYTFTKKELLAAWICYGGENYSRQTFLDDFRTALGYNYSKATKQGLIDFIKEQLYEEYEWHNFCKEAGFKGNFDTVVSCGYHQGDYLEVIVPHKFWECAGVEKPDCVQSELETHIDHLLWDAPVNCRFTVDGDDYYLDEHLSDVYDWDKTEALTVAATLIDGEDYTREQKEVIINFLASALPENLSYL